MFEKYYNSLRKCLQIYDENGRQARVGKWFVSRGGYDLWWYIQFKFIDGWETVIECLDGALCYANNGTLTEDEYYDICDVIIEEYGDILVTPYNE